MVSRLTSASPIPSERPSSSRTTGEQEVAVGSATALAGADDEEGAEAARPSKLVRGLGELGIDLEGRLEVVALAGVEYPDTAPERPRARAVSAARASRRRGESTVRGKSSLALPGAEEDRPSPKRTSRARSSAPSHVSASARAAWRASGFPLEQRRRPLRGPGDLRTTRPRRGRTPSRRDPSVARRSPAATSDDEERQRETGGVTRERSEPPSFAAAEREYRDGEHGGRQHCAPRGRPSRARESPARGTTTSAGHQPAEKSPAVRHR